MAWDEWRAIEQAQAQADAEDARRIAERQARHEARMRGERPALRVLGTQEAPPEPERSPTPPAPPEAPVAARTRPVVDDATGWRLLARFTRTRLQGRR